MKAIPAPPSYSSLEFVSSFFRRNQNSKSRSLICAPRNSSSITRSSSHLSLKDRTVVTSCEDDFARCPNRGPRPCFDRYVDFAPHCWNPQRLMRATAGYQLLEFMFQLQIKADPLLQVYLRHFANPIDRLPGPNRDPCASRNLHLRCPDNYHQGSGFGQLGHRK